MDIAPRPQTEALDREAGDHWRLRLYELLVAGPVMLWIGLHVVGTPSAYFHPMLLLWAGSIALVDLLPVATTSNLDFSLSFPLQLAVALIYSPPVAAWVALIGTSDIREIKGQLRLSKALFIRTQIAVAAVVESELFHAIASFKSPWLQVGAAVIAATAVGYAVNVLLVAWYIRFRSGEPVDRVIRRMHVGIFGEFLLSYMGLALFGVVIAAFFVHEGVWSVAVFIAPLAFARQMFSKTNSLQRATEELEARQQENQHQALHDSLTGLPNRAMFSERLQSAITAAQRSYTGVGVMIMDLDQFKEINDTLGHHYGDLLLQQVGHRLQAVVREEDTVARLGGDEFGVVVPNISSDEAVQVAERVLAALEKPLVLEGLALDVSASIGIAQYPTHSVNVDTLMRNADVAMYAAKETHAGYETYSTHHDRYSPTRLALLGQVRPAMERQQFDLHFQPKADLTDGRIRGVEALVRWQHPERGLLLPDEFIPLIERTVLLRPFTMHVLNEALRRCYMWRHAGLDVGVAVNLSPRNLLDQELPEQVGQLLSRWGVPAFCLRFEITESSLMADSVRSADVLARLHAVGVGLSIDDFGTGYSSLSYLKRLPVDEIKIDKSFVMNMASNVNDATIVRATADLSHSLGLRVVAEGVETAEAWDQLTRWNVDVAQGFFLSRPIPGRDLISWLREYAARDRLNSARRGRLGRAPSLHPREAPAEFPLSERPESGVDGATRSG